MRHLVLLVCLICLIQSCRRDKTPLTPPEENFIYVVDTTLIHEMVARVDTARVWQNMLYLTSWSDRGNYSTNIEEVQEWIFEYLIDLGFSVEYQQYLWEVHNIYFSSLNHGILRNAYKPDSLNVITTDGGNTWHLCSLPQGKFFFFNENSGYVYKDEQYIKYTSDGGHNWELRISGFGGKSIYFLNEKHGWLNTGWDLFKTFNGGQNWLQNDGIIDEVRSVSVVDSLNLWVGTRNGVAYSHDAGVSWELKLITGSKFNDIIMLDHSSGIIVNSMRDLYTTEDGGLTWTKSLEGCDVVAGVPPGNLWASSVTKFYISRDKGKTWTQTIDFGFTINEIAFTDSLNGWITTRFGVFRTKDGGYNWEYYNPAYPMDFTFENVVATIPGKLHPEKEIILMGHLDTVNGSIGADDNSSSIVALLEFAEILCHYEFEYTIKIIMMTNEENDIGGSKHYSYLAKQQNENIIAVLNFDVIGYWVPGLERDLDVEYNEESEWLADEILHAANIYTTSTVSKNKPYWPGTPDHRAFWAYDYSAVMLSEDGDISELNPYINSSEDLLEYINRSFFYDNVKAGLAAGAHLAKPVKKVPIN